MVVLHATDPASIFLSAHARAPGTTVGDIEDALFVDRALMRTLAMRRTLFVASRDVLPLIEVSSSADVARTERKSLLKFLTQSDIPAPERWLDAAFVEVLGALDGTPGVSARELTELVPRLATRIVIGGGKYTQEVGATSRVLGLMAVEGHLARGRPSGSWTTRQYVWHRRDQWIPAAASPPSIESASTELLARWLHTFGPGTMVDLRWWTGWTKAKVVRSLEALDVVEVDLEHSQSGYLLASDIDDVPPQEPWVALLPSLDPTPMGWKERDWYVGGHEAELFDRNGNIGPTVWADGEIVGGWSSRADGGVAVALFEPLHTDQAELLAERTAALEAFLDGTVVKPSFPTPLQKRLAG